MCYIDDVKGIVTSWTDFERLINAKVLVYVDKTEYVYKMAKDYGGFYFISRPRRFGKSLMCSTLDALFSGKRELFEGLWISGTDYGFMAYPVLRFDFSTPSTDTYEDFLNGFKLQLRANAARCGLTLNDMKPAEMMAELLSSLVNPVIIIDESDSAIIDAVSRGKGDLAEDMRACLNSFYKVIKSHTGNIRFLFVTGCTKLSGLSVFSAMNNLRDISLSPEYDACFGYTEEELLENFPEHIDEKFKDSYGEYETREEFLGALRNYYYGYRFSPESRTRVYNPVSIGNYFSDSGTHFSDYWMDTGGMSTLAVMLARNIDLMSIVEERPRLSQAEISHFDLYAVPSGRTDRKASAALLYYAGYLTIAGARGTTLSLDFPNAEVRTTMLALLLRSYTREFEYPMTIVEDVVEAAGNGDHASMVRSLNEYYRLFNYTDFAGCKEQVVRILFKAFFGMLRLALFTEIPSGKGRVDAVLVTDSRNYIFELKVDGKTSTDAFGQVIERHYAWLFPEKRKPLHLVGIDFRSEKQQIVSYTHKLYGNDNVEQYDIL